MTIIKFDDSFKTGQIELPGIPVEYDTKLFTTIMSGSVPHYSITEIESLGHLPGTEFTYPDDNGTLMYWKIDL